MAQRRPVVVGNWKMNPRDAQAAIALAEDPRGSIAALESVERILCPPSVYLAILAPLLAGTTISLGAQNIYFQEQGAFTGEISAPMLAGLCAYVIIGHSERRALFGETDESVRQKVQAALSNQLRPIVCVGETSEQREAGETGDVLRRQVHEGLEGLELPEDAIIAYEPVWAIGTGRAANVEMAAEACGQIRLLIAEDHGRAHAAGLRVLYGGSVTAANAAELFGAPEIDGALVGGASLKAGEFSAIIHAALT